MSLSLLLSRRAEEISTIFCAVSRQSNSHMWGFYFSLVELAL
jgi:hypothetical protein